MHKIVAFFVLCFFTVTSALPPIGWAQGSMALPVNQSVVPLSAAHQPPVLKGIRVYEDSPLRFDFILDKGDSRTTSLEIKKEANKLVKYFLASLTVPEKDLWVNLSPYEKDRVVPQGFGETEMGREFLAQDYVLKQVTANLMHPDSLIGKRFWQNIYAKVYERYGSTDIPVDTFNKVWIVPEQALVYEGHGAAYVLKAHLRVMLEQDYVALKEHNAMDDAPPVSDEGLRMAIEVVREFIIPELENAVNQGAEFASLRQIYSAFILASWYKNRVQKSLLNQVYANQNKTAGVSHDDMQAIAGIWDDYVKAFKQGAYNFIREEKDPFNQDLVPRKYFSGGLQLISEPIAYTSDEAMLSKETNWLKSAATMLILAFSFTALAPEPALAADRNSVATQMISAGVWSVADRKQILDYVLNLENRKINFSPHWLGSDVARKLGYGDKFANFYDDLRIQAQVELNKSGRLHVQQVIAMAKELIENGGQQAVISKRLEQFFKGVWSNYIIAQSKGSKDVPVFAKDLVYQAGRIAPDLKQLSTLLVNQEKSLKSFSEAEGQQFLERVQDFNDKFLHAQGYYFRFSIIHKDDGTRFYYAVVYQIVSQEWRMVNKERVRTFYVKKVDETNSGGDRAHTSLRKRDVYVNVEEVDELTTKRWMTAQGTHFRLNVESQEVTSPVVTALVLKANAGKSKEAIKAAVERSFRAHEYTHQAQTMLKVQYKGTDRFDFPINVWKDLPVNGRKSIDIETVAMLAQVITAEHPSLELVDMLEHYLSGEATPYYFGVRWIFYMLDDMPTRQWLVYRDQREIFMQLKRLAADPQLKEKARALVREKWSPALLKAIEEFDAAQVFDRQRSAVLPDVSGDPAVITNTGGIDFGTPTLAVELQQTADADNNSFDAVLLSPYQNTAGFFPVMRGVQLLESLPSFLGIKQ